MSVLQSIQDGAKTRLEGLEYFEGMNIITEDKGDIEKAVNIALANLGVSVLILMSEADCEKPNVRGPYLDNIVVVVAIAENVVVNRRGESYKTALDVAEHVANGLHLFKPESVNEAFVCTKDAIRIVDPPRGANIAYEVKFTTAGGLQLS